MRRKTARFVAVVVLTLSSSVTVAQTAPAPNVGPAGDAAVAAGYTPVGGHPFPAYYRDATGLQVEPCLVLPDGDDVDPCVIFDADNAAGGGFDPDAPIVFAPGGDTNFPAEVIYFAAEAPMTVNGARFLYTVALEGAFEPVNPDDPTGPLDLARPMTVFSVQVRVDSGLQPSQEYTITHPYGVHRLAANADGSLGGLFFDVAGGEDEPAFPDFQTRPGAPTAFLVAATRAPGFLGDLHIPGPVTGSPFGTNFVRIEGPGITGCLGATSIPTGCETSDIAVAGKVVQQGGPVAGYRLTGLKDGRAGVAQTELRVIAVNAQGDMAGGGAGPAQAVLSADRTAALPGSGTPLTVQLPVGFGVFSVTPQQAGALVVTASDPTNPGATGSHAPVTISAGDASQLVTVSGNDQVGVVAQALPADFVVRVTDAFGNPVAGATVTFTAPAGASVAPASTQSGADGLAVARGTLGPAAGAQRFAATAAGATVNLDTTARGFSAALTQLTPPAATFVACNDPARNRVAVTVTPKDTEGADLGGSPTVLLSLDGVVSGVPMQPVGGATGSYQASFDVPAAACGPAARVPVVTIDGVALQLPDKAFALPCSPVDVARSTVTASTSQLRNDGRDAAQVTVAPRNTCDEPMRGLPVEIRATAATVDPATGTTDASAGTFTATVTSRRAGDEALHVFAGGTELSTVQLRVTEDGSGGGGGGGGCSGAPGALQPAAWLLVLALLHRSREAHRRRSAGP